MKARIIAKILEAFPEHDVYTENDLGEYEKIEVTKELPSPVRPMRLENGEEIILIS